MASHTYDCRICGEHKELHRCVSACSECREKHNIPDFEPTPDEQVKIILTIAAYVAIIAAIIVSAVKLFNWIFSWTNQPQQNYYAAPCSQNQTS